MRRIVFTAAILVALHTHAAALPPDVNGPGAVLREANLRMKVTNWGVIGNPYPHLSSDPSARWPDDAGAEYLNSIALAVGAVDPTASGPTPRRRVSYQNEWSPRSSGAEDRLYRTFERAVGSARFINDDGDFTDEPLIDEEFRDGRDDDGDGLIDEDCADIGYETYTCVMSDTGPYRASSDASGVSVPLGLEVRQMAWDYVAPGFYDFAAIRYTIVNRSGHRLDSVYVGFKVDMDVGPFSTPVFFNDDRDLPGYPSIEYVQVLELGDPQRQLPHATIAGVSPDSALCARISRRLHAFSMADDDGDGGQTPGVASVLLLDHTVDPLAVRAPTRVGFRAFRSFLAGTPFQNGGNPIDDDQRYQFLSGDENVDPANGFITQAPGTTPGDYAQWCSVGPFLELPDGGQIQVTIAFAVYQGSASSGLQFPADYMAYRAGTKSFLQLVNDHPPLANAFTIKHASDGRYQFYDHPMVPDFHGRETPRRQPPGGGPALGSDCRDLAPRLIDEFQRTWFDYDCDYCTGVWDYSTQHGLIHTDWFVALLQLDASRETATANLRWLSLSPNPSRAATRLDFELAVAGLLRAEIHDVMGRRVRTLADGPFGAGRHDIAWDGADDGGKPVAPGVYLVRLRAGAHEVRGKLVRIP
jgi:hypothetical protein